MSLSQAISSALSGLRTAQAGVDLVANNIANADTPGYVRKSLVQTTAASSAGANGAQLVGVNRELDLFVQRQLRSELAGGAYATTRAEYYSRIERVYGQPGAINALDTRFNSFTNSLQALATTPESIATRSQVLNEAAVLAQQLNAASNDIQELRSEAEFAIGAAVGRANEILQSIEQISTRIVAANPASAEAAALLDTRDALVAELSGLIDIRVVDLERGQISIFTSSGVSLFDHSASRLSFDGHDGLNAQSLWSADPNERGVGTITLTSPSGYEADLVANGSIRSGEIAALLEMRDGVLVQAQAQLDEIAHSLALSLSNRTEAGTAVAGGPPDGFALDIAALQNGNSISLTYSNGSGTHRVTIVRVDDPAALPLDNSFTPDANDTVVGVNFSGGMAGVVTALNAALGSAGLTFDNPAGSVLRVLDDGAPDLVDVDAFNATVTTTTLDSGDPTLPFFADGSSSYTNFATAYGSQKLGFAARIVVNPNLKNDPSLLVAYTTNTPAGDATRPDFLLEQLTATNQLFAPATGIGSAGRPYSGTLSDFIRQTISLQGAAAENSARLKEGQDIVVNSLQSRFAERSSVNVDAEMANLLLLQTAYGANARVLSAVQEMIDALMRI